VDESPSVELVEPASTGFRGAWRHRPWRRLVSAFAVSATGDWLYSIALYVWLLERTGSAAWIAAAVIVNIVPAVLFGPLAGVVADRWDRRRVLVSLDLARAAIMLVTSAVVSVDGAPIVAVALVAVNAVLGTAYRPAIAAATPQVVDEQSLAAANATESAVGQVTWFLGPALGSLVLAVSTPAWAFVANGITFTISASLLLGVRLPALEERAGERHSSFVAQLREGVEVVRHTPDLVVLLGLVSAVLFAFGFEEVLHVLVAEDRLGIGAAGLGWMTAFMGIGGLAAAPFAARVARTPRAGLSLGGSALLMGLPLALLAIISSAPVAYAVLFVEGVGNVLFEVLAVTLLQRLAPPRVLGRVFGLQDSAAATARLVGALLAPLLVASVSLEVALVAGGGVLVLYATVALPALGRAGRHAQRTADELEPRVEVLARLPFLDGAQPETLESIAAALVPESVDLGTVLLTEGAPADDLYVVRSGTLDILKGGVKVNDVGADEVVGEIGVINRLPRTATVVATSPVELWRVPGGAFLSAIERHDIMPDGLRRGVADRLAQLSLVEVPT
jgi:MFS family permease